MKQCGDRVACNGGGYFGAGVGRCGDHRGAYSQSRTSHKLSLCPVMLRCVLDAASYISPLQLAA
jgi:hypothetical protein